MGADRKGPCGTQEIGIPAQRTKVIVPVAPSAIEPSGQIGGPAACETTLRFQLSAFQSFLQQLRAWGRRRALPRRGPGRPRQSRSYPCGHRHPRIIECSSCAGLLCWWFCVQLPPCGSARFPRATRAPGDQHILCLRPASRSNSVWAKFHSRFPFFYENQPSHSSLCSDCLRLHDD